MKRYENVPQQNPLNKYYKERNDNFMSIHSDPVPEMWLTKGKFCFQGIALLFASKTHQVGVLDKVHRGTIGDLRSSKPTRYQWFVRLGQQKTRTSQSGRAYNKLCIWCQDSLNTRTLDWTGSFATF